jgi:hypothetical protein
MREAYTIMELANLKQPSLSTTLMGCVKGAADYFGADLSVPMLFGITGHAFLINIHDELCPSSPYVWNKVRFWELLAGLGMEMVAEFGLSRDTPQQERLRIEGRLREHLDAGELCMLDFLEHQLIGGYDDSGFAMLRPWGCDGITSEVPTITYGTWEQCLGREGWAHLSVLARRSMRKSVPEAAKDAIELAVEVITEPRRHEVKGYRIGLGAYESWIAAVERGLGSSHGHWWNGMVWTECRRQAAAFFRELGELTDPTAASGACSELAGLYGGIAESLGAATPKELRPEEKLRLLQSARDAERKAPDALRGLQRLL